MGIPQIKEARKIIHALADSPDEWLVQMTCMIASSLIRVVEKDEGSACGSFGLDEKEYYFTVSDSPDSLGKLEKMLRQTVVVKAGPSGPT